VSRPKQDAAGGPDAESFARFLAWLDPDPERAAERYTEVQRRLTRMFDYRGCEQPEELADETISRVLGRIASLAESYEGDPIRYFYGVARNVLRQHFASRHQLQSHALAAAAATPSLPEDLERRHACLDRCLESVLTPDDRHLILEYYRGEKGGRIAQRDGLAQGAAVSGPTLRKRTERIRRRLQECLLECLEGEGHDRR
jgi:DNA-directed RNA polymerase specialized sigma24 family protein